MHMSARIFLTLLCLALLLPVVWCVQAAEFQVTNNAADQTSPAIWEGRIVWTDARNKNLDVYMYDTSTGNETRITKGPKDRKSPAIWENTIAAVDLTYGSPDIYVYNLITRSGRVIVTGATNQKFPRVSGTFIAWETSRNGDNDIAVYNTTDFRQVRLPTTGAGPGALRPLE